MHNHTHSGGSAIYLKCTIRCIDLYTCQEEAVECWGGEGGGRGGGGGGEGVVMGGSSPAGSGNLGLVAGGNTDSPESAELWEGEWFGRGLEGREGGREEGWGRGGVEGEDTICTREGWGWKMEMGLSGGDCKVCWVGTGIILCKHNHYNHYADTRHGYRWALQSPGTNRHSSCIRTVVRVGASPY